MTTLRGLVHGTLARRLRAAGLTVETADDGEVAVALDPWYDPATVVAHATFSTLTGRVSLVVTVNHFDYYEGAVEFEFDHGSLAGDDVAPYLRWLTDHERHTEVMRDRAIVAATMDEERVG